MKLNFQIQIVWRILLIIVILVFCSYHLFSQSQLKGIVKDAEDNKNLAFVNISISPVNGVITDINGNFLISNYKIGDSLKFSYVGYRDTIIAFADVKGKKIILLRKKSFELSAVEVLPGINPAHRIIKGVIRNKKNNDPENLDSYTYRAYHKTLFLLDSLINESAESDSISTRVDSLLDKMHLFLTENVSIKKYKSPNKYYEKVIASKISGLKNPYFLFLSSQMQSFSFYEKQISFLGKNYESPINNMSLSRYFYQIEDSIIKESDTTFIIFFRPLINTSFQGLKGLLYINSNSFAIENVLAEPAIEDENMDVRIKQYYRKFDGHYFPVQLNTELTFNSLIVNSKKLKAISYTYLDSIKINPELTRSDFSNVYMEVTDKASEQDSIFWANNRFQELSNKELNTYVVIDSIGEEQNFDEKAEILFLNDDGQIPIGPVGILPSKIYDYNLYEKSKLGLGISTNSRISEVLKLNVYFNYAFGIKKWNYGGEFIIDFFAKNPVEIAFEYNDFQNEIGSVQNFNEFSFLNEASTRGFLTKDMYHKKNMRVSIDFRLLRYFKNELSYEYSFNELDYNYLKGVEFVNKSNKINYFNEFRFKTRFAFNEKVFRYYKSQYSGGTNYPVLHFSYTRGENIHNSNYYNRYDFKLSYNYKFSFLGKSSVVVKGGILEYDKLPFYKLYEGNGTIDIFYIAFNEYFNTMKIAEFFSDRYVNLFFSHDFGKLFNSKITEPKFKITTALAYGTLNSGFDDINMNYKTLEDVYYESGIQINEIFKSNISSVGLGFYYRYGKYSHIKIADNIAVKFTSSINL